MRSKHVRAFVSLLLLLSFVGTSRAGLICAVIDKCKSNPTGIHAKLHAKVQEWKYAHPQGLKPKCKKCK